MNFDGNSACSIHAERRLMMREFLIYSHCALKSQLPLEFSLYFQIAEKVERESRFDKKNKIKIIPWIISLEK
jgi:hypothetical protein